MRKGMQYLVNLMNEAHSEKKGYQNRAPRGTI